MKTLLRLIPVLFAAIVIQACTLYAPDAILMPPNDATAEGNASIRNWFNGFLNQFKVQEISTTTDEIIHAGE